MTMTHQDATAIVDALRTPPAWMTAYQQLPEFCRWLVDEYDHDTTDALLDELTGLLMIDEDQDDRIHACHVFAQRWSAIEPRVAVWWNLVAVWLARPR